MDNKCVYEPTLGRCYKGTYSSGSIYFPGWAPKPNHTYSINGYGAGSGVAYTYSGIVSNYPVSSTVGGFMEYTRVNLNGNRYCDFAMVFLKINGNNIDPVTNYSALYETDSNGFLKMSSSQNPNLGLYDVTYFLTDLGVIK